MGVVTPAPNAPLRGKGAAVVDLVGDRCHRNTIGQGYWDRLGRASNCSISQLTIRVVTPATHGFIAGDGASAIAPGADTQRRGQRLDLNRKQ